MKEIAKICEVTYPRPTKDKSMPQRSVTQLYDQIRNAKNKAECIMALRKCGFIPWNDVPKDVWDKLERFSSTSFDKPEK
jgi:hypothetical protein